jgi:hypothetical protein
MVNIFVKIPKIKKMERIASKLFRLFALLIHLYYLIMIIKIWGIKIKTFLFLTKINFFVNCFLFSYLFVNSLFKFDLRENYFESGSNEVSQNKKEERYIPLKEKFFFYSKREMTLIKVSFALSVCVNILYWVILYLKKDFMGDTDVPMDVEYFLHGGNFVVILLECFFNRKSLHNKIDLKSNHVIFSAFTYITLKYVVYFTMDIQIYPMISKLSVPLYYMLAVIGFGLYLLSCGIFKILFL